MHSTFFFFTSFYLFLHFVIFSQSPYSYYLVITVISHLCGRSSLLHIINTFQSTLFILLFIVTIFILCILLFCCISSLTHRYSPVTQPFIFPYLLVSLFFACYSLLRLITHSTLLIRYPTVSVLPFTGLPLLSAHAAAHTHPYRGRGPV